MNQGEATSGTLLVGGTLLMAAMDGAVMATIGAAGLGYLGYKAFADIANRPADQAYTEAEDYIQQQIIAVQLSDDKDELKSLKVKELRDQLCIADKYRQHNANETRGSLAQWVGVGIFAWPILAPIYLGGWVVEKAVPEEQRERWSNKFTSKRLTREEVLERARARWEEAEL